MNMGPGMSDMGSPACGKMTSDPGRLLVNQVS